MKHWFTIFCAVIGGAAIVVAILLVPRAPVVSNSEIVVPLLASPSASTVLFVGDIMLDRNVAVHARAVGDEALFKGVLNLFAGHDAVIGNLEGTLTTKESIAQQDNSVLRFTFDPHFAQLLAGLGFSAVSLANNHALDFGEFGYDDTLNNLEAANVGAFGAPYNDSHLALQLMAKYKKICMVGYHSLFNPDTTAVLEKIQTIRSACDYVIVMAHWGVEYQHEPVAQQQEAAHAFIDAGADVVIGGHPHVVEPLEIYNGHAIFYSLGNFLFDQGWKPEVKRGLAVEVAFEDTKTRFTLMPVTTYEEVSVAGTTTAQAVLKDVVTPELSPDITKSILETGSFELENKAQTSSSQVI